MGKEIDPSKITNKFGLAAVIVLVVEGLFVAWFAVTSNSAERIVAGCLGAIVLVAFFLRVFPKSRIELSEEAEKLIGNWKITSVSEKGHNGVGTVTISKSESGLTLVGSLLDDAGKRIGTLNSEVTRVNENRLIFYYILRDVKLNKLDAVSILIFDPANPNTMTGDWIVASTEPHYGTVTYERV